MDNDGVVPAVFVFVLYVLAAIGLACVGWRGLKR